MRTLRLVATLGAALSAAAFVGVGVTYLAWALGGCYLAFVPLPDAPVCATSLWPAPWVPFALLLVSIATLAVTIVAAVRAALGQFDGARRQRRSFERHCVAAPARLQQAARISGLHGRVQCVSTTRPVACTIGVARPTVYVSTGLLEVLADDELAAVMAHEAEHVRGRDPLVLGAVRVAHRLALIWPLVRRLADRTWLDLEARADARAIGAIGRGPFLSALYGLLSAEAGVSRDDRLAVGSIDGLLADRLAVLEGQYRPRPPNPTALRTTVLSTTLIVASTLVIVLAAFRAAEGIQ